MLNYKYSLLLGGFFGFSLTLLVSFITDGTTIDIISDASIGCVVGAILMRIFLFIVELSLKSLQSQEKLKDLSNTRE